MYEDKKHGDKKMGFLIFAARKLQLRRQINQGQYRDMCLANKLENIQSQVSIMQESIDSAKQGFNSLSNGALSIATLTYNNTVSGINNNSQLADLQKQLTGELTTQERDKITAQVNAITTQQNKDIQKASATYELAKQSASLINQGVNSIFEMTQQAQLKALNQEETHIQTQKEHLESQLKVWDQDYESVKKGEEQEAKNVAPTFGLS